MDQPATPSRARYITLLFLASLTFVLYLDRVCIGKAVVEIQKDLEISDEQMGWVFGAFTFAYGLFEVPAGRWGDRWGSRGVLTRIVVWWSAFTVLTGCVGKFSWDSGWRIPIPGFSGSIPILFNSFVAMALVRFLFGAGEAGALPNNARIVSRWFPLAERGLVQGVIITCMPLGGASSAVIAGSLIENFGWRSTFYIFGSLGIVWAMLFYWWFCDNPAEHPGVNAAEAELIRTAGAAAPGGAHHAPIPWRHVLCSPSVWLLGIIMTCCAFFSYFYMTWLQKYLQVGRGIDEYTVRWMAFLILGSGAIGSMAGGWVSGRIERWTGSALWGRRLLGFATIATGSLMLAYIPFVESTWDLGVCAILAGIFAFGQQANWWSAVMSISGSHLGSLFGLMNSMGVVGGTLSPIFFGKFVAWRKDLGFEPRDQMDPTLFVFAGVLFFGACCWLFVNPTRSAVGEEMPHKV